MFTVVDIETGEYPWERLPTTRRTAIRLPAVDGWQNVAVPTGRAGGADPGGSRKWGLHALRARAECLW